VIALAGFCSAGELNGTVEIDDIAVLFTAGRIAAPGDPEAPGMPA
jgi:hypothetical protein